MRNLLEHIDTLIGRAVLVEGKRLDDIEWSDIKNRVNNDMGGFEFNPSDEQLAAKFRDYDLRDIPVDDLKDWPPVKRYVERSALLRWLSVNTYSNTLYLKSKKGEKVFLEWLKGPGGKYLSKSGVGLGQAIVDGKYDNRQAHEDLAEVMFTGTGMSDGEVIGVKPNKWLKHFYDWNADEGVNDFVEYLDKKGYLRKPSKATDEDVEDFIDMKTTYGTAPLSDFKAEDLKELPMYDEIADSKKREAFYRAKSHLYNAKSGRGVRLFRAIQINQDSAGYMKSYDGWLEHLADSGKSLGIYWTDLKEKAIAYWGHGGETAVIEATAPEKAVDWEASILLRMNPAVEDEEEVRLHKGAPLKIENIWIRNHKVDLPREIKRKTFKA